MTPQLQRLLGPHAGEWKAIQREVFNEDGEVMAVARDGEAALYLSLIHNSFLPLLNAARELKKDLGDLRLVGASPSHATVPALGSEAAP